MISRVTFEKTTYNEVPYKFEAGTPHIEGVIAFGAAIDYWNTLDLKKVAAYENQLLKYATEKLCELKEVRLIGMAKEKGLLKG